MVADAQDALPTGIEQGGVDGGHAGGVGVQLGRDIELTGAGFGDHCEQARREAQPVAGDVGDVDRRAGEGGSGDHLFERGHALVTRGAQVDEAGGAGMGGGAKHLQDFPAGRAGRVLQSHADAERAAGEALLDLAAALGDLGIGGGAMGGVAGGQECAGVVHHAHAHGDVADGCAVVDEGLGLALIVKGVHIGHAHFELERGGHAIHGFGAVVLGVLAVRVEIDEAGGDHQAGGVDRGAACERGGGDGLDLARGDAKLADGVEAGFRIDDAAVADDEIVLLSAERRQWPSPAGRNDTGKKRRAGRGGAAV